MWPHDPVVFPFDSGKLEDMFVECPICNSIHRYTPRWDQTQRVQWWPPHKETSYEETVMCTNVTDQGYTVRFRSLGNYGEGEYDVR